LISYFNKINGLSRKTRDEGRAPSGRKFWWFFDEGTGLRGRLSDAAPIGIPLGSNACDHEDRRERRVVFY